MCAVSEHSCVWLRPSVSADLLFFAGVPRIWCLGESRTFGRSIAGFGAVR